MTPSHKAAQLQVRVSQAQKRMIRKRAERAGMTMSDWILSSLLPSAQMRFQEIVAELAAAESPGFAFAELLDWITPLPADEFVSAVAEPPAAELDPYWKNYLAATVEHAAMLKQVEAPGWTEDVAPLDEPHFVSTLQSVKLHLLIHSLPAFIARNIFIDSSVGARV